MTGRNGHGWVETVSADQLLLLDVLRGVLGRCGGQRWVVRPEAAWCRVVSPSGVSRKHGWKLHVSATPLSAPLVLARAAEVLVRHGTTFKFATDIPGVIALVGSNQDRGASGKFLTVYPDDDEQVRVLAAELDRVTADLVRPRILSDRPLRAGSLVHYRYGSFAGDSVFNDQGVFESRMVGPDGSEVGDERTPWFAPPPWAVSPFAEPSSAATLAPSGPAPSGPAPSGPAPGAAMRLGGRFRVTGALRHANKGGVFRAVDERDGGAVVVKQARAHVGARLDGRDMRDVLRHEARILRAIVPAPADAAVAPVFPALVELFEEQGDLFLVEEEIEGTTADRWAAARSRRGDLTLADVAGVAAHLVRAVRVVHEAGMVLCDLKPGNVMVTPAGGVRLIDAEVVAERGQQWIRGFTVGFAAPELLGEPAPGEERESAPPADWFSLGVTLFSLASGGLEAHWVAGRPGRPRSTAQRRRVLARIAEDRPALKPLRELIVGLTETDPERRWSLDRAEAYLAAMPRWPAGRARRVAGATASVQRGRSRRSAGLMPAGGVDRLLADGVRHLRDAMTPQEPNLWRSSLAGQRHDPCDAWRGAAGVLATLTRAARVLDDPKPDPTVARAAAWVEGHLADVPRILPGLCFGRAGTAWALHDAGRFLGDDRLRSRAVELARRLPTHGPNPDVALGQAGAGLALLWLWQTAGEADLLRSAVECAESLLSAAQRDGDDWHWSVPRPASAGGGRYRSYGFAHGAAGIGMFLLATARAAGEPRCHEAALGVGDTLLRGARRDGGAVWWPAVAGTDDGRRTGAHYQWCNGPAGIGTFLVRLSAATGDQRFADVAVECAPPRANDWATSVGSCCGLSGCGHLLLDLAGLTGDDRFRARAEEIAAVIYTQAGTVDGLLVTCQQDAGCTYAEGTSGVLDFLLRLRHGGPRPWLPELGAGRPPESG